MSFLPGGRVYQTTPRGGLWNPFSSIPLCLIYSFRLHDEARFQSLLLPSWHRTVFHFWGMNKYKWAQRDGCDSAGARTRGQIVLKYLHWKSFRYFVTTRWRATWQGKLKIKFHCKILVTFFLFSFSIEPKKPVSADPALRFLKKEKILLIRVLW
jgi:hypothetical protein